MSHSDRTDATSHHRVVIVGAGVAGITAANHLVASGQFAAHDVCVLEGSDRIGGRVKTRPFSDDLPVNVEFGAAWIHGTQGHPFAELAKKFGIEWKEISPRNPSLHPGSCANFALFDGNKVLSEAEVKETWKWQDLLLTKFQRLANSDKTSATRQPLAEIVDTLLETDVDLHPLVANNANGRDRLLFCVRKLETYMGATADELQIDDFIDIDCIGYEDRVLLNWL